MKISKIIKSKALPSFCTANTDVIYTILSYCKYYRLPCLIECTSNQVNQHGGYTQKTPKKFIDEIFKIAKILNLKKKILFWEEIILALYLVKINLIRLQLKTQSNL